MARPRSLSRGNSSEKGKDSQLDLADARLHRTAIRKHADMRVAADRSRMFDSHCGRVGDLVCRESYSTAPIESRSITAATERCSKSTDTTIRGAPSWAHTTKPFTPANGPRSI
jgi:hypothetical protein